MANQSEAPAPDTSRRIWPNLAVVGGNQATSEETLLAENLGGMLASLNVHVLCGGKTGVMAAVARGFQVGKTLAQSPGVIIGLLPGPDKSDANSWLDVALPTGLGVLRNGLIARGCDLMIAIGGGSGTLSEIVMAWHEGKPVALLGRGGWSELLAGRSLDARQETVIPSFDTLAELGPWLNQQLKQLS
ncbi:MAG: TIGR00725 family protein [Candidatus Sericytochromatia bacterium]